MRALKQVAKIGKAKAMLICIALSLPLVIAGAVVKFGLLGPVIVIVLALVGAFVVAAFVNPKIAFAAYATYAFILGFAVKSFLSIPVGLALEGLLILTWLSILFNARKINWSFVKNIHVILALVWFVISLLQVLNPYGGVFVAWFNELRSSALSWVMLAPIVFVLLNKKKDLDYFLIFIIAFSALATLYGVKQLHIGLTSGEQAWLASGNDYTHILKGQLRAFSIYSDAGQFGASQATMAVVLMILAFGPFEWYKRILFGFFALLFLYGMAISGTRGALFGLAAALFYALFLTKNFKILIIGGLAAWASFAVLKYTTIGNDIFQVQRLRSALDPNDESFQVRLANQQKIADLLDGVPFGAGLGTSGVNGTTYNAHLAIANVQPDSYWVKVWVMYGIVGLIIWIAINSYIIGKCSGIIFRLKNKNLKNKAIALTSGTVGLFVCSYGNEIMNAMPSLFILVMSWSFVLHMPALDDAFE